MNAYHHRVKFITGIYTLRTELHELCCLECLFAFRMWHVNRLSLTEGAETGIDRLAPFTG